MGADRAGAVSQRAAQAEIHPPGEIACIPMGLAVALRRIEGTGEAAVGIGGAVPDEALVEMGVDIDEAWHDERPARIDYREIGFVRARARGRDAENAPVPDHQIDMAYLRPIRLHAARREHAMGHAGIIEAVIAGRRDRQEAGCLIMPAHARPSLLRVGMPCLAMPSVRKPHLSRDIALSCQRRNSICENADMARKMITPVTESSTRAAKRRGMLRRNWLSMMR